MFFDVYGMLVSYKIFGILPWFLVDKKVIICNKMVVSLEHWTHVLIVWLNQQAITGSCMVIDAEIGSGVLQRIIHPIH